MRIFILVIGLFYLSGGTLLFAQSSTLDEDFAQLVDWFEGRFDNAAQVEHERAARAATPHDHQQWIFRRVEMPKFGRYVFLAVQRSATDTTHVLQRRVYRFLPNFDVMEIEMNLFDLGQRTLSDQQLRRLDVGDLPLVPGCEVFWHREQDHFTGESRQGECYGYLSDRQRVQIDWIMKISATAFEYAEQIKNRQGQLVGGYPRTNPYHYQRKEE
ncbi:MAG: hypothetical protein D6675_15175 [Gemmatimonadetes bacterium]|nr:MAG: hypothetical protein D6675_15175 [Gemmatimonadota bacterium]